MTTRTATAKPNARELSQVLTRAFMDDPFVQWLQPDPERRARRTLPYFELAARYALQHGGTVETGNGDLKGASIWLPPESPMIGVMRLVRTGFLQTLLGMGIGPARRYMKAANAVERYHKRDQKGPHWYLWVLGVDPPYQGQGVGKTLIETVLSDADTRGVPCYVESANERNLPFYQRNGFKVLVEDVFPDGGPRYWTMRREPGG